MKGKSTIESWPKNNPKSTGSNFIFFSLSGSVSSKKWCKQQQKNTLSRNQDIGLDVKGIPWWLLALISQEQFISSMAIPAFQELLLHASGRKGEISNCLSPISFIKNGLKVWWTTSMERMCHQGGCKSAHFNCQKGSQAIFMPQSKFVSWVTIRLQNTSWLWAKATALGNPVCLSQGG